MAAIRWAISLPGLKLTAARCGTSTRSLVRGLRALRGARRRFSEVPQFDAVFCGERLDDAVEGSLNNLVHQILAHAKL